MAQPRIGRDDEQIDNHVDDDEQRAEHQRQSLNQRQVAIDDGVDRHVADAGIGEDALDDDSAADQEGELHARQRQRRRDRVAQRLLQDEPQSDLPLSRASST